MSQSSLLKSNFQFETFGVLLRRTSIGFSMYYTKIFPLKSEMNNAINFYVFQIDVEKGLTSTLELKIVLIKFINR